MSLSNFITNMIATSKMDISAEEAKIIAEFQAAEASAHKDIVTAITDTKAFATMAIAALNARVSALEAELKNSVKIFNTPTPTPVDSLATVLAPVSSIQQAIKANGVTPGANGVISAFDAKNR